MPPAYPVAPSKKQPNVLKIVLVAIAAVVVVCLVGIVGALLIGRSTVDNVKETTAKVSIVEPQTLGGRAQLTGAQFTAMTDVMEQGLTNYKDATNSFSAFYGTVESQDIVVALGVERPVFAPEAAVTGAINGLVIGGLQIDGVASVDPGPMGGAAKCGNANAGGTEIAICSWADEGSVGILMWYFSTADQVIAEFTELRAEIETKTS
jgi:hypothetical protein